MYFLYPDPSSFSQNYFVFMDFLISRTFTLFQLESAFVVKQLLNGYKEDIRNISYIFTKYNF